MNELPVNKLVEKDKKVPNYRKKSPRGKKTINKKNEDSATLIVFELMFFSKDIAEKYRKWYEHEDKDERPDLLELTDVLDRANDVAFTIYWRLPEMNEIELSFCYYLLNNFNLVRFGIYPQQKIGKRRVDFWIQEYGRDGDKIAGLAVEINGSEYHTGLDNEIKDHERDLELTRQGIEVIYLTGKDVYNRPEECCDFIKEKLDSMVND